MSFLEWEIAVAKISSVIASTLFLAVIFLGNSIGQTLLKEPVTFNYSVWIFGSTFIGLFVLGTLINGLSIFYKGLVGKLRGSN